MPSLYQILSTVPALLVVANAAGTALITKVQGTTGTTAGFGLQVDLTGANDANIINKTEITDNITNECGRTLLAGNIDIGQNTETLIANKSLASTTKGGKIAVTILQGGATGAGPYTCDVDQTSNSLGSGQTNVTVAETDGTTGTINLELTMPTDLACVGASTGNVCTVRCFNAQNLGGCFSVTQTDVTAKTNTVENIETAQTLSGVLAQVITNQKDLPASVSANHEALNSAQQGTLTANALLKIVGRSLDGTYKRAKKIRKARLSA